MPKVVDEDRIFEVAAAIFVREGFAGTTTKAIATQAGVSEVTLFRRYENKAALLGRAIDHQWRDVPLAKLQATDDVEADLLAIVEAYVETNRLRGSIVPAVLVELARSKELRKPFGAALKNVGGLAAILRHHQAEGRLVDEDPLEALTALIGPLLVREMFRRAGVGRVPKGLDLKTHVRCYLAGRGS